MIGPLQGAKETLVHSSMPYSGGKQQLGRQKRHQLSGTTTGADPYHGESDPCQQDLPDPYPTKAGTRYCLPDGGLPDVRPAVAHYASLQQIQPHR